MYGYWLYTTSKLDFLAEDVCYCIVKGVGVDGGLLALLEALATVGENLAYSVCSVETACVGVFLCCPNEVSFYDLDYDGVVGHGEQVLAELLAAEALLPNAPQHPLMAEGGEVRTNLLLVLRLLVALSCVSACCTNHIFLYLNVFCFFFAPLAAEVEMFCRPPLAT